MFWPFAFPTKNQSQTHYFQNFLVTKYLRGPFKKYVRSKFGNFELLPPCTLLYAFEVSPSQKSIGGYVGSAKYLTESITYSYIPYMKVIALLRKFCTPHHIRLCLDFDFMIFSLRKSFLINE